MQNLALRYHYYVQLFNFFILIFMSKSKTATATLETSGNNCLYVLTSSTLSEPVLKKEAHESYSKRPKKFKFFHVQ